MEPPKEIRRKKSIKMGKNTVAVGVYWHFLGEQKWRDFGVFASKNGELV